jgi:hypothetical protein
LIAERRALRRSFVLGAKPTSPAALFAQLAEREQRGADERGSWEEGTGRHRRFFAYRSVADVPLPQSGGVSSNFLEVWERYADGTVGYHNSWVTDLAVPPETVAAIVGIGRSRWQIEKAQCNVHKNHGDEVEHNYGHGQQTLSLVFYLLNLLAFLAHKLLEFGDRLYPQCRAGASRRGWWPLFRSACYLIEFATWEALLHSHLRETTAGPSGIRQTETPQARSGKKPIVTTTSTPFSLTEGYLLLMTPLVAVPDSGKPLSSALAPLLPIEER